MTIFAQFDDDANGSISFPEFAKALRELGLSAKEADVRTVFDSFDFDNSGAVAYDEFHRLLRKSVEAHPRLAAPAPADAADAAGEYRDATGDGSDSDGLANSPPKKKVAPTNPLLKASGLMAMKFGNAASPRALSPRLGESAPAPLFRGESHAFGLSSVSRGASPASPRGSPQPKAYVQSSLVDPASRELPFKHVRIGDADADGGAGGGFDAWELVGGADRGSHGTNWGSANLAIVTHPLTHVADGSVDGLTAHVSVLPLHRHLIDAGWSVLAYEASALAAEGSADAQLDALCACLDYVSAHHSFRYSRIALLAQGVGASAALKALATEGARLDGRLGALVASQPAAIDGLLDVYAPACRVPTLLAHAEPAHRALDASSAEHRLEHSLADVLARGGVDARLVVAQPVIRPWTPAWATTYPLYGAARRFDASHLYGDQPHLLLDFLHEHVGAGARQGSPRPRTPRRPTTPRAAPA